MPPAWHPDRRLDYSSMEVHLFRKLPCARATDESEGDRAATNVGSRQSDANLKPTS
jgi:hypothetical protein